MTTNTLSIVTSVGHAEYMLPDDHGIGGLTITSLWPSADIEDVYEAFPDNGISDGAIRTAFGAAVGHHPDLFDADPYWERVVRWDGDRAAVQMGLVALLNELQNDPGGDDGTFDYWPSGARYALTIARALGEPFASDTEAWVRDWIVSMRPDYKNELLGSCGVKREDEDKEGR